MPRISTARWRPPRAASHSGARPPPTSAAGCWKKAADLLRERIDQIARVATTEEGKTLREAKGEVMMSAAIFEWFAEEGRRAYGRVLIPARTEGVRHDRHEAADRRGRGLRPLEFPDR